MIDASEEDEVWKNLARMCSECLQLTMHALKFVRRSKNSISALSTSSAVPRAFANAYDLLHALTQKLIEDGPAVAREDCTSLRQAKIDQMYRCVLDVVKRLTPEHQRKDEEKSARALMGIDVMDVIFLS